MNAPSAPVQSPLLPMIDGAAIRRDAAACLGCGPGVTMLSGARLSRRARCETRPPSAFSKHFRPLTGADTPPVANPNANRADMTSG